ncbi:MAG: insulinase family protein [Xanthobacteraceae bacterium]|nr:insulinase family protein [Xanthobacteraceae bacterium]
MQRRPRETALPINLTFCSSAQAIAGVAVAATLFTAGAQAQQKPDVGHFMLANGLEVVVVPDRRTPVVTHMVWYKVGAADEPPGTSGIAHFLEHLMFKGTAKNPAGRFSQAVAAVGGQENAFTSQDYTGYFQRVSRDNLKTLMEFEADRMTGLVLANEQVVPELKVVLEEQNQRVANSPRSRLSEQIDAALYLNHPYGKPVIGWRHEIEKLNREDALAFYKRFYTPNNAVLVVAGDVTTDEIRTLAEATYGKVAKVAEIGPRRRPQEPAQVAARHVTLADVQVQQPSLSRAYLVPSSVTAKAGESEALEVLSFILGHGTTSRLYRNLVVERELAVSAGGWYNGTALDASQFSVYGSPKPGVTLEQLEGAIDAVIDDVVAKGVTPDEVERAKNRLIADAIYAQDSQATMARWYGAALTTGSSVQAVQSWPDRIRAVTADSVSAAAKAWLDKRRSVTGYLIKDSSPREEKRS